MYRSATGPAFGPLKGGGGVARLSVEGPPVGPGGGGGLGAEGGLSVA